jgi:hypothetical protein
MVSTVTCVAMAAAVLLGAAFVWRVDICRTVMHAAPFIVLAGVVSVRSGTPDVGGFARVTAMILVSGCVIDLLRPTVQQWHAYYYGGVNLSRLALLTGCLSFFHLLYQKISGVSLSMARAAPYVLPFVVIAVLFDLFVLPAGAR